MMSPLSANMTPIAKREMLNPTPGPARDFMSFGPETPFTSRVGALQEPLAEKYEGHREGEVSREEHGIAQAMAEAEASEWEEAQATARRALKESWDPGVKVMAVQVAENERRGELEAENRVLSEQLIEVVNLITANPY
jgi:hypothetical protein